MQTTFAEVQAQINNLINEHLNINILESKLENNHFFSKQIDLLARELIFFFFKIEEIFGIKIQEDEILSEEFYSLNGLSKIVTNACNN